MITLTVEMIVAVLKGKEEMERVIPYRTSEEWPLDVYKQFFPYKIERFTKYPHENTWEGMIIHKNQQLVIGDMGFKGGPDKDQIIHLGYSIVPGFRGHGFATEMGKAIIEWGLSQPNVKEAVATCNTDNEASKRVLEKIGFKVFKNTREKIHWHY
ncbi:N-acetyltransferase [Peribacillus deserti]|uniref:N-acetyltransferase n=2 Tax=Peribacillus deserti TaxID=673318 RepID=A0A2N5M1C9_9BACI|nr:N-acetyltransferase [Peribacillus deserti]